MVEKKFLNLSASFITEGGVEIKQPVAAYEEYGNPQGPVVLLCHGGLSNQHAADVTDVDKNPGWWDKLVGPGNVFDTDIFRILSINALGSIAGTTSATSINPDTGKKYGKDFPYITMVDHANFLKQVLGELGVEKLFWAAGLSTGSLAVMNLAVLYPEFVGAITPVASAAYMTVGGMAIHNCFIESIKQAEGWADGEDNNAAVRNAIGVMSMISKVYYTHYSLFETMTKDIKGQLAREEFLTNYLAAGQEAYADGHNANAVITCLRACNSYDIGKGYNSLDEAFARLSMPALVISTDTDPEFPPQYGKEIVDGINKHYPGNASFHMLHSVHGHLACVVEGEQLKEAMMPFKLRLLEG